MQIQHVIQNKNGIMKQINVNENKIIVGILVHEFAKIVRIRFKKYC